ncbi:translation initiation factor IF-2-like isoform X1 [Canis lupus familiaris]|uniref:translation initiation factor IF-2-like isoform X1 n=1 Tax=Canis lupus familiaris TaxID=9615 RepID=UPI0015F17637|nr:translation initiation factor IF-2-like isoform X1 [Canis lupus familiaris]XP_038545579.1 translation initiation factor IF-2-like isoform X1 [Canis lupus familiaris]
MERSHMLRHWGANRAVRTTEHKVGRVSPRRPPQPQPGGPLRTPHRDTARWGPGLAGSWAGGAAPRAQAGGGGPGGRLPAVCPRGSQAPGRAGGRVRSPPAASGPDLRCQHSALRTQHPSRAALHACPRRLFSDCEGSLPPSRPPGRAARPLRHSRQQHAPVDGPRHPWLRKQRLQVLLARAAGSLWPATPATPRLLRGRCLGRRTMQEPGLGVRRSPPLGRPQRHGSAHIHLPPGPPRAGTACLCCPGTRGRRQCPFFTEVPLHLCAK